MVRLVVHLLGLALRQREAREQFGYVGDNRGPNLRAAKRHDYLAGDWPAVRVVARKNFDFGDYKVIYGSDLHLRMNMSMSDLLADVINKQE